jgi:hypothetical protein
LVWLWLIEFVDFMMIVFVGNDYYWYIKYYLVAIDWYWFDISYFVVVCYDSFNILVVIFWGVGLEDFLKWVWFRWEGVGFDGFVCFGWSGFMRFSIDVEVEVELVLLYIFQVNFSYVLIIKQFNSFLTKVFYEILTLLSDQLYSHNVFIKVIFYRRVVHHLQLVSSD